MAMMAGLSLSRIILIAGAGYTGTIVLRNRKLSDILADFQDYLKEKNGENVGSDSDSSDVAAQVRRLAMEIRQLGSARTVTVIGGESGNITALIVPAAALGALGYGYMWWKGISFSDLMYVTKRGMATAVSNMTNHLEQVNAALAAAKRHLTQRIENLDGKLDEQKVISKEIRSEVADVRGKVSNIGIDLSSLQDLVSGLDGKINAIEYKQKFTCDGVMYLCQFVQENGGGAPNFMKDVPKLTGKPRYTGSTDTVLKGIALAIESGTFDKASKQGISNGLEA